MIDNHSVAVDLLTKGGGIVDAGARGFVFSEWFASRGHSVLALDPSPDIKREHYRQGISFLPYALVGKAKTHNFLSMVGDPGAWHMTDVETEEIPCVTHIDWLGNNWDVIKLNIEGSEYDVLDTWPGPIARQIVVSFHEHTPRARGRAECDRLIAKMGQWYKAFNVVWEKRYCCSENYWDVLFIRNDLV